MGSEMCIRDSFSTCSKCDRKVDVKVLDDGCLVQLTKCGDCANVPVIKDVCSQQK